MIRLNDIRRAIAERPFEIREILLTAQQSQVLRFVRQRKKTTRSSDIVKRFDLSPSHACMVMDGLYRKGYVRKQSQPQDTGGYEYEFVSAIDEDG